METPIPVALKAEGMKRVLPFICGALISVSAICQSPTDLSTCRTYQDTCVTVGALFVRYIVQNDFEALSDLMADSVYFRGLIPPGLITSRDPDEVAAKFESWFRVKDTDIINVLDSDTDMVGNRAHFNYKIMLTYKGTTYHIEQQVYCDVRDGKISKLSMLCSGFQKMSQ